MATCAAPAGRGWRADRFLDEIADPAKAPVAAGAVAIVVAHPDDETIGIGGQLARLDGVTLVTVTDGAPRNLAHAAAHGFESREAYAAARRRELETAIGLAGQPQDALVGPWMPDQSAAFNLCDLAHRLADLLTGRGIGLVVTHPYEGGHPDHDACAFAVHAACALLARRGRGEPPGIVEMAFYHAGPDGWVVQEFPPVPDSRELVLHLGPDQRRLKEAMIAAHRTQARTLAPFPVGIERFRPAPAYDFAKLPNGGRLLYECYDWGMTGDGWQGLTRAALRELGLGPVL